MLWQDHGVVRRGLTVKNSRLLSNSSWEAPVPVFISHIQGMCTENSVEHSQRKMLQHLGMIAIETTLILHQVVTWSNALE
jgi:hypothetical protein